MTPLHLRKILSRSQDVLDSKSEDALSSIISSATWEVQEMPGLYLSQFKNPRGSGQVWGFDCPEADRITQSMAWNPGFVKPTPSQVVAVWNQLYDQQFATRKEALQALDAVLMMVKMDLAEEESE